jgi:hypothetical protein
MAPQYPFSTAQSSSSSTAPDVSTSRAVSASARAPVTPQRSQEDIKGSPSFLRSRLSPRKKEDTLESRIASYPSPARVLGIKKKQKADPLPIPPSIPLQSSLAHSPIPVYDARGYPTKASERARNAEASPSAKNVRRGSTSSQSSFVSISTTGAGLADGGRLLTPDKSAQQQRYQDGGSPSGSLYPPIPAPISYSLSSPSYDPYGYIPAYEPGPSPAASLYGDSRVSLDTVTSAMQFGKYDALRDPSRGDLSITSRGGQRGLADMVGSCVNAGR